jgi:hypothetical protein
MISYLIASFRPEALEATLKSIKALPPHAHEIVVCTPTPKQYEGHQYTTFIMDDKLCGSTYAFNKGVKHCNGDWIVIGIDDHVINYDVYSFLDLIHRPDISNLEYQVINLGSPWTDCLSRNVSGYRITLDASEEVLNARWPVITFPAVSKKTIHTKFDGHIFHPDLLHHFVDHWMGLFVSRRQPNYDFNQAGQHAVWNAHLPGDNCDRSRDDVDSVMFCKLAARYIQNPNHGYIESL